MQKPVWSVGSRTGKVRKFLDLSIFACEGLICIIDERPGEKHGECKIITPAELMERITSLNIPYRGETRVDLPKRMRRKHDLQVQGSQNCVECIKEARAMGDPSDPKVQEYWRRHRSNNTVSMSFSDKTQLQPSHVQSPAGRAFHPDGKLATQLPAAPTATQLFVPPKRRTSQKLILPD